jgi:short-subunit dehydrogenase
MKEIDIITGASSGMGVCFAKELFLEFNSDEIWLFARRKNLLEKVKTEVESLKSECKKNSKIPIIKIFDVDLTGVDGAKKVKEILEKENNQEELNIRVLVNNAGFGTYGEFINTDTDREMEMVELNCTSLTGITGYSLPYMKSGSRIINTASLASFLPLGNFAVYGATKSYVLSLSVALAAELKPKGISVTALCPGPVSTEFANVASKGARKEVRHGLSPEKTVRHAVKASRRKKLYSMYAFKWKFKATASKFISRCLGAWATYKFCKRPSN